MPPPHPQTYRLPAVINAPHSAFCARFPHVNRETRLRDMVRVNGYTHKPIVREEFPTGNAEVGVVFTPLEVPLKYAHPPMTQNAEFCHDAPGRYPIDMDSGLPPIDPVSAAVVPLVSSNVYRITGLGSVNVATENVGELDGVTECVGVVEGVGGVASTAICAGDRATL